MTRERIGIIGLGRMGSAMATRLSAQGFAVTGWTRRGLNAEQASALGICSAADLAALVDASDIMILSLMDDAAVESILGQLGQLDLSGRLVVETSTVSPKILPAHQEALQAAGSRALDAPISGGPQQVLEGTIGLYIGGAAEDVARFRPVAEQLSNRIHHIGPLGHGATAKLVNNMMLLGLWQTLKEALQLGQAAGLARETMLRFLETSPAASPAFKSRLPVILGESDSVGFSLSGVVKDAGVVMDLAAALDLPLPAMAAARQSFLGAEQAGLGERDLATMVRAATESKG
ncbi:3-hydroxyisobutyrate dehydrogenase [Rhizobium sp. RU35A]|uniref:NAD(P)-dependent oxidoreductase n=1 Tax=Rhizobium sp. RU35A TaxID=1907414 RepID=UPI000956074C|nr:NAD(P)-dependent oxidoreductase [Rhizobium sp. RU35A]SIR05565.1 3-hydroxyisobutyrate dehydrogenase [Rhizobium sp. RU35A]